MVQYIGCGNHNHLKLVGFIILQEIIDSLLFAEFVWHLIEVGTLRHGDIFFAGNCIVHMQDVNVGTQEALLHDHRILILSFPPYHPDLNPAKLVINCLLLRLRSQRARWNSLDAYDFLNAIEIELNLFSVKDVKIMFNVFGYNTD